MASLRFVSLDFVSCRVVLLHFILLCFVPFVSLVKKLMVGVCHLVQYLACILIIAGVVPRRIAPFYFWPHVVGYRVQNVYLLPEGGSCFSLLCLLFIATQRFPHILFFKAL